jgi:hypothetical protein
MPARTAQIYLYNATSFPLNLIASHLCHGKWTNKVQPPQQVTAGSQVSWESQSDGFLTGTQGWAKYTLTRTTGENEQVLVSWDNPYVPAKGTPYINGGDSTYNISPPCGPDSTGGFVSQGASTFPDMPKYQVGASYVQTGKTTVVAFLTLAGCLIARFGVGGVAGVAAAVALLADAIFDASQGGDEVGYSIFVQVGLKGSVGEALPFNYDKSKGLRPLANEANTSSIRKLIGA